MLIYIFKYEISLDFKSARFAFDASIENFAFKDFSLSFEMGRDIIALNQFKNN